MKDISLVWSLLPVYHYIHLEDIMADYHLMFNVFRISPFMCLCNAVVVCRDPHVSTYVYLLEHVLSYSNTK